MKLDLDTDEILLLLLLANLGRDLFLRADASDPDAGELIKAIRLCPKPVFDSLGEKISVLISPSAGRA
jgi:hypothetical protein